MPKYKSPTTPAPTNSGIPRSVESYLDNPTPEGGRNKALYDASSQLRDADFGADEAERLLGVRASADGLGEREIATTIESAYRANRREPPVREGGAAVPGRSYQVKGRGERQSYVPRSEQAPREAQRADSSTHRDLVERSTPVPPPEPVEGGFVALLKAAFEEGEGVCIGGTNAHEDGTRSPAGGVVLPREKWIERVGTARAGGDFSKVHTDPNGHYIRLNPMRIDPKSKHTNDDATAWRHTLVEFDLDRDGNTIPKDRQYGAFVASGLPITCIIDSGNKSLHAWVKVDAENEAQYKERCAEVYSLFESIDIDGQNHNVNRYSRCPDGKRTVDGEVVHQRLLRVGMGAENWKEWCKVRDISSLGEVWNPMRDFENYPVDDDPNTVLGKRWMCKGGAMVFVAQSGAGKSALNMQLTIGWALAREDMTFGIAAVKPLRQLVIQAENDQGDCAEAWLGATRAYELSAADKELVAANCQWRRITTKTGDEFIDSLETLVKDYRPDICWIDPLMSFFAGDMSSAEDMLHFCVGGLNRIAAETGVVWGLVHHTGKPKERGAGSTASDLAYAGIGSSALTNWAREIVTINRVATESPHDPATFTLTATKRRTRGGMQTMLADGDDGETHATSEIWIRHSSDGTIRWLQCPEPAPAPSKGRSASRSDAPPKSVGRSCSLSSAQKHEIVATAAANGGRLTPAARTRLATKFDKSPKTINRYLAGLEQKAALGGGSVEEALQEDVAEAAE